MNWGYARAEREPRAADVVFMRRAKRTLPCCRTMPGCPFWPGGDEEGEDE